MEKVNNFQFYVKDKDETQDILRALTYIRSQFRWGNYKFNKKNFVNWKSVSVVREHTFSITFSRRDFLTILKQKCIEAGHNIVVCSFNEKGFKFIIQNLLKVESTFSKFDFSLPKYH